MKISISEVKRRMQSGIKYIGEFVGVNRRICQVGNEKTEREVIKSSSSKLVSKMLNGPKAGTLIYLTWSGVTADEREGSIYLTMNDGDISEEFLKISLGQV